MSDSVLYIFVVGKNNTSKQQIASYLADRRIGRIKLFFSTAKLQLGNADTLETERTISGHDTIIVVTPDITKPSWTYQEKDINSFEHKVILYVVDDDCASHVSYMKELKDWFQCPKFLIYFNSNQTSDTTNDTLTLPSYIHTIFDACIRFNSDDSNSVRSRRVDDVFLKVSDVISRQNISFSGPVYVDDDTNDRGKCVKIVSDVLDSEDTEQGGITEESEGNDTCSRNELDDNDWKLYSKTLNDGSARSNHVRVNVVGNLWDGKTTLIQRLQGKNVKCPDTPTRPTKGICINQVTSTCIVKGDKRLWSPIDGGYEEKLNIQRMAAALQKTSAKSSKESVLQDNTPHVSAQNQNVEFGSDEFTEGVTLCEMTYRDKVDNEQKKNYLQNVKKWCMQNEVESMYISFWDFTGQSTFYATHQAFIAPYAVNLIVFDLSMGFDAPLKSKMSSNHLLKHYTLEESLKFWVSSIRTHTYGGENVIAPFIIVGTHKDKVDENVLEDTLDKIGFILRDITTDIRFFSIDNTCVCENDQDLHKLRDEIINLGVDVINEEIPAQWINLEHILLSQKAQSNFLKFCEVVRLDNQSDKPIKDLKAIKKFLDHEQRRGFLLHFESDRTDGLVILDPNILVNLFNTLSLRNPNTGAPLVQSFLKNRHGIVSKQFIVDVANHEFGHYTEVIDTVVHSLLRLNIIHEFQIDKYIIPSLLRCTDETTKHRVSGHQEKLPILRIFFCNAFINHDFFHLLCIAMNDNDELTLRYDNDQKPSLYNTFASFEFRKKKTMRLDMYLQNCMIYLHLKNYSKQKIAEAGGKIWREIIELVELKMMNVLKMYRQKCGDYKLEVECPRHPSVFIDLNNARKEGEAMCDCDDEEHALSLEELCLNSPVKDNKLHHIIHDVGPTHKELGRLCRQLSSENAKSLASKLNLQCGINLAEQSENYWPTNKELQLLHVLEHWKRRNPEGTTSVLIQKLSELRDHDKDRLHSVLQDNVQKCQYDRNVSRL
ncbi:Leucine-rich repeat serine/threonine-protein kinase 2 [Mactra antiquata]